VKAIVYERCGPPEVLHLAEVEKPVPRDDALTLKAYVTPQGLQTVDDEFRLTVTV
jgi:hypothetical protein